MRRGLHIEGLILLAGGCADSAHHVDPGRALLIPPAAVGAMPQAEYDYPANEELHVVIEPELSEGGCPEVDAWCTATLTDSELVITAEVTIDRSRVPCKTDSWLPSFTCETPPLPPGTYTVAYGAGMTTLTVPGVSSAVEIRSR